MFEKILLLVLCFKQSSGQSRTLCPLERDALCEPGQIQKNPTAQITGLITDIQLDNSSSARFEANSKITLHPHAKIEVRQQSSIRVMPNGVITLDERSLLVATGTSQVLVSGVLELGQSSFTKLSGSRLHSSGKITVKKNSSLLATDDSYIVTGETGIFEVLDGATIRSYSGSSIKIGNHVIVDRSPNERFSTRLTVGFKNQWTLSTRSSIDMSYPAVISTGNSCDVFFGMHATARISGRLDMSNSSSLTIADSCWLYMAPNSSLTFDTDGLSLNISSLSGLYIKAASHCLLKDHLDVSSGVVILNDKSTAINYQCFPDLEQLHNARKVQI